MSGCKSQQLELSAGALPDPRDVLKMAGHHLGRTNFCFIPVSLWLQVHGHCYDPPSYQRIVSWGTYHHKQVSLGALFTILLLTALTVCSKCLLLQCFPSKTITTVQERRRGRNQATPLLTWKKCFQAKRRERAYEIHKECCNGKNLNIMFVGTEEM